jgi:type I restriction enzyme M protein
MPRKSSYNAPQTTAQSLGSLIKTCRDIMRKDKGLTTDLDRLPMLTWIMFLKFLDDMEHFREAEAKLAGKRFYPVIEAPYRWRDWATKPDGVTGDALINFITNEETIRSDGSRGLGLFTYLRSLRGADGGDRRDVVRVIFQGTVNRMINGYLLRDVINKVNSINFASTEEIFTLGHLYESMLKEMRDAAGENGEFYTPRPLVKFIVAVINPQLGETILDPACGTGGFLAASFEHLKKQCQTTEDHQRLQRDTLFGIEAKPLPYLLCQMNMLLHGIEYPNIDPLNALRFPLREIGEKDRFDIIMTNPPFGGEEEKGIQGNFPEDGKTSETALLFLQLIMRKLHKVTKAGFCPARAAVVVPNGTLYSTGVAARIRAELLRNFNLHTVVRLPKGVFEPYADIPTNILFFDTSKVTDFVWFYQHPLPPQRAILRAPSYSLSDPLRYEEFLPLIEWWNKRSPNDHSWTVTSKDLADQNYNLDQKNPNHPERSIVNLDVVSSCFIKEAEALLAATHRLERCLVETDNLVKQIGNTGYHTDKLERLCHIAKGKFPTKKTKPGAYTFVVTTAERRTADSYQFDGEAVCVPLISSTGHGHAAIHRIHFESGKFALADIMAALITKNDAPVRAKYLYYYLWKHKDDKLVSLMAGTANTSLTLTDLKSVEITYPPPDTQDIIVAAIDNILKEATTMEKGIKVLSEKQRILFSDILDACLDGVREVKPSESYR